LAQVAAQLVIVKVAAQVDIQKSLWMLLVLVLLL
jgi:hypothetical protein